MAASTPVVEESRPEVAVSKLVAEESRQAVEVVGVSKRVEEESKPVVEVSKLVEEESGLVVVVESKPVMEALAKVTKKVVVAPTLETAEAKRNLTAKMVCPSWEMAEEIRVMA